MISYVIPYVAAAQKWEELRYALRSLENFREEIEVFIVADELPRWMKGVVLLKSDRKTGVGSKGVDAWKKMVEIVNCKWISDDFIYAADDIYWLAESDLTFFGNIYAQDAFPDKNGRIWNDLWWKTYHALGSGKMDLVNYETHMPRLYNKHRMQEIIKRFNPAKDRLLAATLYYNIYNKEKPIFLKEQEGVRAQIRQPEFYERIETLCQGKVILNHNDMGLAEGLKKWISGRFNKKSRWER
jgi:hypothetical protein